MSITTPEIENVAVGVSPPLESLPLPLHAVARAVTQSHRVEIMGWSSEGGGIPRSEAMPSEALIAESYGQGAWLSAGSGTAITSRVASTAFFHVRSTIDIAIVTSWHARISHGVSASPSTSSS